MPLSTPIIQLLASDPISVEVGQKLSDAHALLSQGRFHHLPVVDSGKLVGMLSTNDLLALKAAAQLGSEFGALTQLDCLYKLRDVMRQPVISVSDRATVGDAARQLSAGGFHSLPVVDRDQQLVGIVTTTDLIAHMLAAEPRADLPAEVKARLRTLEHLRQAAEAYLHSGQAAPEHRKLELALEAARATAERPLL